MILLVCPFVCAAHPAAHFFSVGATLLIETPISSHLFAAYYLIARLTSSVSSASPTILSLEVPQLELIDTGQPMGPQVDTGNIRTDSIEHISRGFEKS